MSFVVSLVQGECLSLTAYKMKEMSLFKCMEVCLRYVLVYDGICFLLQGGTRVNANCN